MSSPAEDTPTRPRHAKGHYASLQSGERKSGKQDLYETPEKVTREIVKLIPDGVKIVWEPCYGNGAMLDVLADIKDATGEQRYKLIGTDFFTEAPDGKLDFLTDKPPKDFDMIITNPPFVDKLDWLEKFKATGKPFIFLYPLDDLATVGVGGFFEKNADFKIFILKRTPDFLNDGKEKNVGKMMWVAGNGAVPADTPRLNWLEGTDAPPKSRARALKSETLVIPKEPEVPAAESAEPCAGAGTPKATVSVDKAKIKTMSPEDIKEVRAELTAQVKESGLTVDIVKTREALSQRMAKLKKDMAALKVEMDAAGESEPQTETEAK
jgi:hypothetical protein